MHITQPEIMMTYINMGLILLLVLVAAFACIIYVKRRNSKRQN